GGTGTVGRQTARAAREARHEVRALSRANGADVQSGTGLSRALDGVDAVIDVTNITSLSARRTRASFEAATRHLLEAEVVAGAGHAVALSLVGFGACDASCMVGGLAQEMTIAAGAVPVTIARAAQFHDAARQLAAGEKGPLARIPFAPVPPDSGREV